MIQKLPLKRCAAKASKFIPEVSMKIAIFGGSFDPPHRGHFQILRELYASSKVDAVLVSPSGRNQNKTWRSESFQRRKMIELMVEETALPDSFVKIWWDQLEQPKKTSTTFDLLSDIRKSYPEDELFFVIGSDLLLDIQGWYRASEYLHELNLIVFPRPGFEFSQQSNESLRILLMEHYHPVEISSSELVAKLKAGKDINNLLSAKVLAYIRAHALYC